ncbi:MAG: hypothetical protein IPM20_02985 [Gammaproteobacteria bacterium]|nr:hypothetical protein [Gammaproteobacteria bacterium]
MVLIGLVAMACLAALASRHGPHIDASSRGIAPALTIPVFPDSSLLSKLPEQGEARYLSFGSHSEPEEIRRYFTTSTNLDGWKFTGETAGSAGVVLKDDNGRRLIIDVKVDPSCLLFCQHLINYWLATR